MRIDAADADCKMLHTFCTCAANGQRRSTRNDRDIPDEWIAPSVSRRRSSWARADAYNFQDVGFQRRAELRGEFGIDVHDDVTGRHRLIGEMHRDIAGLLHHSRRGSWSFQQCEPVAFRM